MTDIKVASQITPRAQKAEARELKALNHQLWHFTSVGLGNCRAAQRVRREIEHHQIRSGTGVSSTLSSSPATEDGPVSPSNRTGADARATIEQLTAGLSHLESMGLANSSATLIVRSELSRQLFIQSALLLANAGFDPNEPRDRYGKWTSDGDANASKTNNPSQANATTKSSDSLPQKPPAAPSEETYAEPLSTLQGIGALLDLAGKGVWNLASAGALGAVGDPQDALKQLGFSSDQLKKWGFKNVEEDSGTTGEKPIEQGIQSLPPAARALSRAGEGIVESAPRLAIAAANPALGALAFGATPEGFNLRQAILAAALPFIDEYSGAISKAVAARAGVSSEAALQAFNKMGGAAGVAAVIGTDQLQQIMSLPPEKRKDALIEVAAAIVAGLLLAGTLGAGKRDSLGKWVDENGGGLSENDNIQRGENAMDRTIRQKTDVQKAMYRKGIGQIDFIWGRPGTNQPNENGATHADGYGISHLIAKHGEEVARQLPEVLAKGKVMPHPESANKILVEYNNQVVSLWRENKTKAWVITSFERQAGR